MADEWIALAKLIAHWLSFGPPVMIAALPASALLNIDGVTLWRLELGLAVGTPALAALGLLVSALTAGLRSTGALAGLFSLTFAVPFLFFRAGMLTSETACPPKFVGAASAPLGAMG